MSFPPFNDDSIEKIFENIVGMKIEFPNRGKGENEISENAYDLISRLLNPNCKERLGINGLDDFISHPFFSGKIKILIKLKV